MRGTLEMLVLRILDDGTSHGYAIARRIEQAAPRTALQASWSSASGGSPSIA